MNEIKTINRNQGPAARGTFRYTVEILASGTAGNWIEVGSATTLIGAREMAEEERHNEHGQPVYTTRIVDEWNAS